MRRGYPIGDNKGVPDIPQLSDPRPTLNLNKKNSHHSGKKETVSHSPGGLSLLKSPKKRPSADKLLMHDFLAGDFNKKLGKELLDLYLNGPSISNHSTNEDEEEPVICIDLYISLSNFLI